MSQRPHRPARRNSPAQRLYFQDDRDYAKLPAELGPPATLDLDHVDPRVLTTYAGLLFRYLLDRCGGDTETAVAAYNGGLNNPSLLYATGVTAAAVHAREFMEHAGVLGKTPVALTPFLAAAELHQ